MGRLNVQLIIHPDSKVTIIDDYSIIATPGMQGTLLENLYDYVAVEFLTYKNEIDIEPLSVNITNYKHKHDNLLDNSVLPIFKDGIHYYHKMLIPRLEYLLVENAESDLYDSFYLKDQTFYYQKHFYKYNGEDIEFDQPMSKIDALGVYITDILKNSSKVVSYTELYDNCGSQSHFCQKMLFTSCKLAKCFVNLQRKMLDHKVYNPCKSNELTEHRDFLLSSLYVLDYLKDIGHFDEAQRIIDNMVECGEICSDNNFDCNCHG